MFRLLLPTKSSLDAAKPKPGCVAAGVVSWVSHVTSTDPPASPAERRVGEVILISWARAEARSTAQATGASRKYAMALSKAKSFDGAGAATG